MLLRAFAICAMIGMCCSANSQQPKPVSVCDPAEEALHKVNTWSDLREWEAQFDACDDGFIAEDIDSRISTLLTSNWDLLNQLKAEIATQKEFEAQVFRHIGESISCGDCKLIVHNAEARCPSQCEALCAKIATVLRKDAAPDCLPPGAKDTP